MLRSRKYKHTIILSYATTAMDDYGKGQITTKKDVLLTFADVVLVTNGRTRVENTNAWMENYKFTIRYTDKKFNLVRWEGAEYVVSSIEDVNQAHRELVIIAQRAE